MSESAIATTQYGDLKGTVSIDGFDGPFLRILGQKSNMPPGYTPVGISIYTSEPSKRGFLSVDIYAVDSNVGGISGDDIRHYSKAHDTIPVFQFNAQVEVADLLPYIKRLHIVAATKTIRGTQMVVLEDG